MLRVEPQGLKYGINATVALRAFTLNAGKEGHRGGGSCVGEGPAFGKDGFWDGWVRI